MKTWEKNIRVVEPYVAGEQPKDKEIIKLNTNENPYPPSPEVEKALDLVDDLRKYPDTSSALLVNALADFHGIKPEQIFVGVGSDDVLAMAFLTFFNSEKPILFPDITYSFYDVWAELYQIPYERPLLDDNFRIKAKDYYCENGGIVIANPNAPTSIAEPVSFVRDILEHNRDVVVIVDEAYVDFGGESALCLINEFDNLLVTRTFSKSRSMAGMRIGYAMGNAKLIEYMNSIKNSYNSYTMNTPSIVLGAKSVQDKEYFYDKIKQVVDTRNWFTNEIRKIGFSCPDSSTNFVFATHSTIRAKEIFEKAKQKKIYIRYFSKPRIDNYLRITIGTREEMEKVVSFFKTLA